MATGPEPSRRERLAEFVRRLAAAPGMSSFDDAYRQLGEILNAVEDELTGIPFDPPRWQEDGRMYPPQMDNMRVVAGHLGVKRFRSRQHVTFIGDNGAIEIQSASGGTILSKAGSDGQSIAQLLSRGEP